MLEKLPDRILTRKIRLLRRMTQTLGKPFVSRLSEEQLQNLLYSSHTFKDVSWINRFVFRPYWRWMMDVVPLNAPPTCLLGLSFSFNLLILLLLISNDDTFSGGSSSRWICFLSSGLYFAAFTFSGIDAAGRYLRRENGEIGFSSRSPGSTRTATNIAPKSSSSNPYASAEYIDRVLDSVIVTIKTLCLFHIIGIKDPHLSCNAAFAMLCLINGCFLVQQWEGFVTGIYHRSVMM